ncbi:hypothetical protein HQ447_00625 [bacterium]|nr:hypothetical protein [bacterium]
MSFLSQRGWSILLQTVSGASCSVFLFLSSFAHAIVDTNSNGVSDLWERRFNTGSLFTSFDPAADPDGDGWTNLQEAAAGTDPRDANPPVGFIQPETERIPAVYNTPEEEGGEPTLATPESLHVFWQTIVGKKYSLFVSVDLGPEHWLPIGPARIGSGSILGALVPLTESDGNTPARQFFRVAVEDTHADNDIDGLSDSEEFHAGSSSYLADTDGDGISDYDECVIYHTNPSDLDSDNDGVPDWDELMVNFTNPLTASGADADGDGIPDDQEKHLAKQFLAVEADSASSATTAIAGMSIVLSNSAAPAASYPGLSEGDLDANHDYTGENITAGELAALLRGASAGGLTGFEYLVEPQMRRNLIPWAYLIPAHAGVPTESTGQYWYSRPEDHFTQGPIVSESDFTLGSLSQYLVSRIDSVEWGRTVANENNTGLAGWDSELASYWSQATSGIVESPVSNPTGTRYQGDIIQRKFRIIATRADHEKLSQSFLKVISENPVPDMGMGEVLSAEPLLIEIPKGKFFSDWFEFEVDMVDGQYTTVRLLPVEVIDKDKNLVSKLKVGKMSETGVLSGTGASASLDIEKDSDRFFVRVQGGGSLGAISVKVSTMDNPDTTYNDNATQIDLVAERSDAISKSMLLVADDVDDDHPVNGVADDATGDRTHKVQLGGSFKIEAIKIGMAGWQTMDAKTSAPAKKKVKVKLVNCQAGIPLFKGPCWGTGSIDIAQKFTKERYAQAGIDVEFSTVPGPDIGLSGWLDPGEFPTEVVNGVLDVPKVTGDIIDAGPDTDPDAIMIYLVTCLKGGEGIYNGIAIPPKYLSAINKAKNYGNKIFVGNPEADYSKDFTCSHESMHILLNAIHGDYSNEYADKHMLWHETVPNEWIEGTKRMTQPQIDKMLSNPLAK